MIQLFFFRMHELFGMHNFKLVATGYGSYRGKCSCGASLARAK